MLLGRNINLLFVVNKVDSNGVSLNNCKCPGKSRLATAYDTLKFATDLLSFIKSEWKVHFREDHTPKPFASDELKYFQKAQERVVVLQEEFQ